MPAETRTLPGKSRRRSLPRRQISSPLRRRWRNLRSWHQRRPEPSGVLTDGSFVQACMSPHRRGRVLLLSATLASMLGAFATLAPVAAAQPGHNLEIVASHDLKIGGATLKIDFAAGPLDLSNDVI